MGNLMDNYKTKNPLAGAAKRDWCIAPVLGKTQQVTLLLNDGSNRQYACRYAVEEGSIAIVGREYPYDCAYVETVSDTGVMGQVTEVLPKLTVKKTSAVEIDYVFVENPQKNRVQQCAEFLEAGDDSYSKTLLADAPVRPISYHILKVLAAASVLAHQELVSSASLDLARTAILEKKCIEKEMLNATPSPFDPFVSINEIHIPDESIEDIFAEIGEQLEDDVSWFAEEGILEEMSDVTRDFISLKTVNDYVNKYTHLGAISIMVRGGFKNLLGAYLSAEPPIKEYLADALEILDGIGDPDTYALLKELK